MSAGTHTLSVTLNPTNTSDYATATQTVSLTVTKATPAITWATPSVIPYGTALSAAQLDASSATAGSFVYTPAAGTLLSAGVHKLSVTFTPSDLNSYTTATETVFLMITQAPLTIAASSPAVTYGASVPTIEPIYNGFINGDNIAVLTAQPICSTIYTPTSVAGSSPVSICWGAAADNYSITYISGEVTVNKAAPPSPGRHPRPSASAQR